MPELQDVETGGGLDPPGSIFSLSFLEISSRGKRHLPPLHGDDAQGQKDVLTPFLGMKVDVDSFQLRRPPQHRKEFLAGGSSPEQVVEEDVPSSGISAPRSGLADLSESSPLSSG